MLLCDCCSAPATLLATFYGDEIVPFDVLLCERCRGTITELALDQVRAGLMFVRPLRPAPDGWKCPGCDSGQGGRE